MLASLGVIALLGCHEKRVSPDLEVFEDVSHRALERSRALVDRAVNFEQEVLLSNQRVGRYDVPSIRFAELSADSVQSSVDGRKALEASDHGVVRRWSSDGENGRVVGVGDLLTIEIEPISSRLAGALSVRAVALAGNPVWLRIELGGRGGEPGVVARIDLVSDGELHNYVVDLRSAFDGLGDDSIRTLMVGVGSNSEASVSSIDVLARDWRYPNPWGVRSECIAGETRSGVYLKGRGSLSWPVNGEWHDGRLSFALAQVMPGRRTRVRLELLGGRRTQLLTEVELVGGEPWRDFRVDVGEVGSAGARLELSVEQIGDDGRGGVVFWAAPVLWEPAPERLNVLILLEDALRADRMSTYGHHRATTPFKDAFFADGVRFDRCISQSTKTRFSCPSFMSSLRPFATGVWGIWNPNPRLDEAYVTMAEVFQSRGWATASFLQNANAGSVNGLAQGFERVVDNIPGRADAIYGGQALDWIKNTNGRNFFGYLHVIDPHAPYQPPESTRNWYEAILRGSAGPKWSDPIWLESARRALYDGEVAANDIALPELIRTLEELDLLDDTLIVFIADHGEHLGEHDLWDHIPPSYMQVVHVPMLMRLPSSVAEPAVVDQPVQLVDLMPTVMDLADIDIAGLPLQGRSLLPLVKKGDGETPLELAVVQEAMSYLRPEDPKNVGSLIWDRWHFLHSDKVPSVLFDFLADPGETQPLKPSKAFEDRAMTVLRELRSLDEDFRQAMGRSSSAVVEIDLDSVSNLKALGYLDD